VKTIAEYLEWALQFELLAADETDPKQKHLLKQQASAYHKLAEERAAAVKLSPVNVPGVWHPRQCPTLQPQQPAKKLS
jgi:hypothetical protein